MNIDELINKCLIGEEHLEQVEYEQVGNLLIELKTLRKAYELTALDLACKNHCNDVLDVPDCLDVDGEICECFEECRNKEWLMDFYKAIAMEELKDES